MATKVLKSLKGRRMRLTRLDSCGAPVEGDCTTVVTDGFVQVTLSAEVETGDEYLLKNAWGDFCINEKDADRFKWVTATIQFCEIHPDVASVIGGDVITPLEDGGGDVIGFSVGTAGNLEAFGLEVWTKVAGAACEGGDPEWGYFLLPFIRNGRPDGDLVIENGTLTFQMRGDGFGAESWDSGPYDENPLIDLMPDGDLWAVVKTTIQPPDVTDGCVAWAPPE